MPRFPSQHLLRELLKTLARSRHGCEILGHYLRRNEETKHLMRQDDATLLRLRAGK